MDYPTFASTAVPHMPRRALVVAPAVLAGLTAFCYPRERRLPDAAKDGTGAAVPLALFTGAGHAAGVRRVRKLILTDEQWRHELSAEVYRVTRRQATEFAFANRYWNEHGAGIYRCICCGNALFRSEHKFDSGTGWPSFSQPLAGENLYTQIDRSLGMERDEVRCRKCDAHLGHLFLDGPAPAGTRFCINSAALRLVSYVHQA